MDAEVIVGNGRQGLADNTSIEVRGGKTGEMIVGQAHGEFYEATLRGNVWSAVTAVGGIAPGASLGTTPAFYLHNPLGSGKNLVLLVASMGFVSGTLGAGAVYLTTHTGVAVANPTGGTAITARQTLLGSSAACVGLAFTGATTITQVAIRPVFNLTAFTTSTAVLPQPCKDNLNGEIIVPPGFGVGLCGVAANGTSPLVTFGMIWEEVPIS